VENVTRQEYGLRWNIWKYECGAAVSDDAAAFDHPAIFPDKLAKDHVLSWSNPGDLVLDPFAGSGTTLKAAKELSRRYVGIEINEPYIKIIKNRLAQDALSLGV
jgi:site-specific DNA-methyltransferase (adenine-specific)